MATVGIQDVSFAGSSVAISWSGGGSGLIITQFMDDANPIDIQDVEVSTVGVNCNGSMIRNAKPNLIMISVTVIPNSRDDVELRKMWKQFRVQGSGNKDWSNSVSLTVNLGTQDAKTAMKAYSYTNGTMVSGPGGPVANAEGKMQGRTYTFAFCSVS